VVDSQEAVWVTSQSRRPLLVPPVRDPSTGGDCEETIHRGREPANPDPDLPLNSNLGISPMEKRFPKNVDSLRAIFQFVSDFFATNGIADENLFDVNLIVEEIFTNQVKYATQSAEDILLRIDKESDELKVWITDFNVEPFDVTKVRSVDTDLPLEARKPGGLGLHLVKRLADSLTYDYRDRRSMIAFTKKLES
jgi:anti-sigma regulatory factor (Ser/Thr protein kinase)